jgi:hypothetical protein
MEKTELRIQRVFSKMHEYLTGLIQLGGGHYPGQVILVDNGTHLEQDLTSSYLLGAEEWERVSLKLVSVDQDYDPGNMRWTTVREFQRDIMTWIRLWPDYHFRPGGVHRPIRMSDMIQSFIEHLYQCDDQLLIAMKDVSRETLAVWVRAKNSTNDLKVKMLFPIVSSFNQQQPTYSRRAQPRAF